jgi:hypothetical protein
VLPPRIHFSFALFALLAGCGRTELGLETFAFADGGPEGAGAAGAHPGGAGGIAGSGGAPGGHAGSGGGKAGSGGGKAGSGGAGMGGEGGGPCHEGVTRPCGSDVGTCKPGQETCKGGEFGPCQGATGPANELCNGEDDNCDGAIDEGFGLGSTCDGPDTDLCADDTMTCDGCSAGSNNLETCNGVDDNCNGEVDSDCDSGDCQPTLEVTGSMPSSPNCIDFPVMPGSNGVIQYPCGGGPVTANLGEIQFTGFVSGGFVSLDGEQIFPPGESPDNCTWRMTHHIEGTISQGVVSYSYAEMVVSGFNCWQPCTEVGTVKVNWLPLAISSGGMDLRLRNLERLDARAVQLPHGTEVITRVDRLVGERRVPQGSVGRVTRIDGDEVDVTIVGVGVVRYGRGELSARRVGQAVFAQRRADAWEALRPCVVLEATVGSRAWGLAEEGSDEDRRGVFGLPFPWTQGLVAPPEDLVSADGSATYWAVGKAIRQALRADPNTLEMLFVPGVRALDPVGSWLLEERDAFVSVEIFGTFGRYALGQLRRLEQGMRLAEHRSVILEWLRTEPDLSLDQVAEKLSRVSSRAAPSEADRVHQAKQYIKQLYRSMADQGLLGASEFPALVAFAREKSADFDLPRELRPKNAYNLVRLLATATGWLRDGAPVFEARGAWRERLLAIKRGTVPLADVLAEAESMGKELEEARDRSPLPHRPDVARADAVLRRIGEELARRWASATPGPWGKDAPSPPEVTWNE